MNDILNQLNYSFSENFSITAFVINILIATALLYILSIVYVRYGNAISNRKQLSKVLIIVGITTFVIISIVKSSLALSLGLVGALSIIRFRTAIKEPEELGYFFIAIAVGLGLGANQLLPTLIGFVLLIMVIIVLSKKSLQNSLTQSLFISLVCSKEEKKSIIDNISSIISEKSTQVSLKRLNYAGEDLNLNFLISVTNFKQIQAIFEELSNINKGISISFIDNDI